MPYTIALDSKQSVKKAARAIAMVLEGFELDEFEQMSALALAMQAEINACAFLYNMVRKDDEEIKDSIDDILSNIADMFCDDDDDDDDEADAVETKIKVKNVRFSIFDD